MLALLAFGGVLVFGRGAGTGLVGSTRDVVVAARDIPLRGVVSADDVTIQKMADADVPPNSFTKTTDVQKLIAELNITKGQPITSNMLAKSPDLITGLTPAFLPIPQGFVAVTLPTSELQGVAAYIQPNDYISVLATATVQIFAAAQPNQQQGAPRSVTKTIMTNVHVIRVGAATNQVTSASGGGSNASTNSGAGAASLTVVVTACDAEYLNWFRSNTTLTYELESFKDYKPSDAQVNTACPSVDAAKGVGPSAVDARYGFTKA